MNNYWSQKREQMREALSDSFEGVAFTMVEDISEVTEPFVGEFLHSTLTITLSESKVILSISVPSVYVQSLLESLYPDQTDYTEFATDTLDELANMISGNFFRSIESEKGEFHLSIPYHDKPPVGEECAVFEFVLDDTYPVMITLIE